MIKIKKWIKKPIVIFPAIFVILVAGYFYFSRSKKPVYEFSVAKRSKIIQEVSVTGRVSPAVGVDLAFEKTG